MSGGRWCWPRVRPFGLFLATLAQPLTMVEKEFKRLKFNVDDG
jgi:hypothetical protein